MNWVYFAFGLGDFVWFGLGVVRFVGGVFRLGGCLCFVFVVVFGWLGWFGGWFVLSLGCGF